MLWQFMTPARSKQLRSRLSDNSWWMRALAPILEQTGLSGELWCDLVNRFGKIFKRVAGKPESLAREAIVRGQSGYRTGGSPLPA